MDATLENDIVSFAETLYTVDRAWIPDGRGGWRVKRSAPIVLQDWQKHQLRDVFPVENGGRPRIRNYLDSLNKKLGKSTKAGIVAAYMAATEPSGEVYICAADKEQARDRVFRSIRYAVEHGPLGDFGRAYRDRIDFSNGATIQAFPQDYKGAAGGEPVCVIFDELHTYSWESERRLWDEMLIPPTLPYGIRWVASYAGWDEESTLLQEMWRKVEAGKQVQQWPPIYHNDDAGWWGMITQGVEAYELAPWTRGERGAQYLKEARDSERPVSFQRLFENQWVAGIGDFLPPGALEQCIDPNYKGLPPGSKQQVYLALDIGLAAKGDDCALVGCHRLPGDRVGVSFHQLWQGKKRRHKLKLRETVLPTLKLLSEAYSLAGLWYDPWQGEALAEEVWEAGIMARPVPQSHSGRGEMDTKLWRLIMDGALKLYPDPEITSAINAASAKELGDGKIFLTKAGRRKIDACVALSMAAYHASRSIGVYFF